ncbi:MAG: hypothetical protein EBR86_05675 [Planctomycetia bacterium]|nr:hypothetical protein [Planctomycetia bacterium]
MRASYTCPTCHADVTADLAAPAGPLTCPGCGSGLVPAADALIAGASGLPRLTRCLVCPSTELFTRKDFPQRLGVGIVVAGLAASCVAWARRDLYLTFGILFGTALVDVVLYLIVPDCLACYRCGARYRGADGGGRFGGFDLETHERHRQTAARLGQMERRPTADDGSPS